MAASSPTVRTSFMIPPCATTAFTANFYSIIRYQLQLAGDQTCALAGLCGALPPRLHPRPQPVDHPLRGRIARGDDEQPLQHRLVRIHGLVIEDLRIDQLLAGQVAV